MIEQEGRVVELEGEFAWVETQRQSSCGSCSASKGCGTGALSRFFSARALRTRVLNEVSAQVGDNVLIGVPEQMLVRGSAAVYLVPLLAMMGAAMLGEALAPQLAIGAGEGPALVGGALGFGLGLVWLRRHNRRVSADRRYQPVILRRLQGAAFVPLKPMNLSS